MFKIVAVVISLVTGQVEELTYHKHFPTMPACEQELEEAKRELYSYLQMLGVRGDEITAEVTCKEEV